jgi:hypothetical protein
MKRSKPSESVTRKESKDRVEPKESARQKEKKAPNVTVASPVLSMPAGVVSTPVIE